MSISYIKKEDADRMRRIAVYCFPWMHNSKDVIKKFLDEHVKTEYTLGYYDEKGILMAQVFCFPFEIFIDGSTMKMGGIGFVSSMPEGRHGGRISLLLKEWLIMMKEQGQVLSMLGPFSYEFYRKYGYEIAFERLKYLIPVENLKIFKSNYQMKMYSEDDLKDLDTLYQEFAKKHNGCAFRDEYLWKEFTLSHPFDDNYGKYTYICHYDGKPKGYIIFSIKDEKMNVIEMVYADRETLNTLLSFIYLHQAQIKEVSLSTPMDDEIQYVLPNPRVKREIVSGMMFRVVDVKSALMQRNVQNISNCYFRLKIEDPVAPWNEVPLEISIKNGVIKVLECEIADVNCDIQTFNQIFIGHLTIDQAFHMERLKGKEQMVSEMGKIFKKSAVYNNNGF